MLAALTDNPDPKAADLRAALIDPNVGLRAVEEASGLLGVTAGSLFERTNAA
jgi:hypothetical protein